MATRIRRQLQSYAVALLAVASATTAIVLLRAHLSTLDIALIYLIVVTALSLHVDTGPGIAASAAAFLCFDYLFIPPYYTLTVSRLDHVLALVVFLGLAVLITQLVVRVRSRTAEALRRARETATLYDLSTTLIGEVGLDGMLGAVARRVLDVFSLDACAILLDQEGALRPRAEAGERLDLDAANLVRLARWVLDSRQMAGLGPTRAKLRPPGLPGERLQWSFAQGRPDRGLLLVPVATTRRPLGVLVVARHDPQRHFAREEIRLLETFANQAAIAIERSLLAEEKARAEILARSDELKSALLSAVSHDLRTPLASIKASATSLLQGDSVWSEADRRELLQAIDEEADRLNRLVANLLDLSRIEAGALQPAFDWYDVGEIVHEAVARSERVLEGHALVLDLPTELPPLRLDFVELVQVVVNLLENAAKHSPPGSPITISVRQIRDAVQIRVRDEGIGIPPGEEARIFDTFYRVAAPHRPSGAGVGLAICRGFIEAHGGRIWAERNPERGLSVCFTLPLPSAEPPVPLAAAAEAPR